MKRETFYAVRLGNKSRKYFLAVGKERGPALFFHKGPAEAYKMELAEHGLNGTVIRVGVEWKEPKR